MHTSIHQINIEVTLVLMNSLKDVTVVPRHSIKTSLKDDFFKGLL